MANKDEVEQITAKIAERFSTFGGGRSGNGWNPIADAMKDEPLAFAGMVSVRDVVQFVLDEHESRE